MLINQGLLNSPPSTALFLQFLWTRVKQRLHWCIEAREALFPLLSGIVDKLSVVVGAIVVDFFQLQHYVKTISFSIVVNM